MRFHRDPNPARKLARLKITADTLRECIQIDENALAFAEMFLSAHDAGGVAFSIRQVRELRHERSELHFNLRTYRTELAAVCDAMTLFHEPQPSLF